MAARRLTTALLMTTIALTGCRDDAAGDASSGTAPAGDSNASTGAPVETDNPLLAMTDTIDVSVGGETFTVALALDDDSRVKGLGDVPDIPADRGMLFVFPRDLHLAFVMRDCLVDIDVAFLNADGRVGRMHTMPVQPRREGENKEFYEWRLEKYRSGFPARMALELRAGTLERLGVSVGDVVEIEDLEALKERAE